ncbi:sugar 3,4-ketoisomerase [Penaeicola halotolerans]|uniref:sugar 3,4-ketoisomerase n=1 Tax=Penaeicola halotolerans TaxID=2793196 RepID=UPI001CF89BF7|nr:FdtA/QdtA family cupin domain-containing protein [Penaeicola halotolerans]
MEIPQIINFKHTNSEKGLLAFAENSIKLPFELQRVYWITQVSDDVVRGGHAHYTSMQVIVCVRGSVEVQLEDMTGQRFDFTLSDPTQGLYIPKLCWGAMKFKNDALLVGLASDLYQEKDYIRDRAVFDALQRKYKHV